MATEQTVGKLMKNGLWSENPVFVLLLGMCPTLGVTSSVENGLGMGIATAFVLVMSNLVISMLRKVIPKKMRIPCFIVIIASFVTIVEMLMQAFSPALYRSLGLFIPLIVVNCIVLGRAEAFASKNGLFKSMVDGVAMGAGFTLALAAMGAVRELLGNGTLLNVNMVGSSYHPVLMMIMPPGAFLTLGFLLALMNWINRKAAARKEA
jgi:Na+-translocating ferredoxin:NAD+ oxidoreductase subunit E